MTASPSFESFVDVQLTDSELDALDDDLALRLTDAYTKTAMFAGAIADYVAAFGEAGRLQLLSELSLPLYDLLGELEADIQTQLSEART
jgi:hypothetical protein